MDHGQPARSCATPCRMRISSSATAPRRARPRPTSPNASPGPTTSTTSRIVNVSYDGKKVVFAMRGPLDDNRTRKTRRPGTSGNTTSSSDDAASRDRVRHRSPRKATTSRRTICRTAASCSPRPASAQSKAILLDESKPQFEAQDEDRSEPAFVLHVMNADGSGIQADLHSTRATTWTPTVLANGRVLWSRWDHAPGKDGIHLYTVNPGRHATCSCSMAPNSHQTGTNDQTIEFVERARDAGRQAPRADPPERTRRGLRRRSRHHRRQHLRREQRSRRSPTRA